MRDEFAELARVRRSGFVESRHFGSLVALAPDGSVRLALGDPHAPVLPRSSVKPVQALGCLRAGAPLAGESLAIAAGSHTGQDEHVALVRRILAEAGLDESALGCPPDLPEDGPTRERVIRSGEGATRVRMNCSGKHAAMLSACVAAGWPTENYLDPGHPLQQRIRTGLEELAGEPVAHVAVDGCGAPLLGVSLVGLAGAVRRLVVAPEGSRRRAVADAMRAHPFFVGGAGHLNTDLMRLVPGAVCKGGAEGVIVAATGEGAAVAAKVIDGSPRATTVIALAALAFLGADVSAAHRLSVVPVLGGGRPVGAVELGSDLQDAFA